jgi:hypothetical protein
MLLWHDRLVLPGNLATVELIQQVLGMVDGWDVQVE